LKKNVGNSEINKKRRIDVLIIIRPDLYEYHALPMTDELFWRRIENLRRAALTAEDFEFRLLYYNQMMELMKRCP
jgi:hypothetical protein